MDRNDVSFDYLEFQCLIEKHTKAMKKQVKNKLGEPKKVIVYEDEYCKSFRYEY